MRGTLEEILDETNQLNIGDKNKHWLATEVSEGTLEEILDKTNQLDIGNKNKHWLATEVSEGYTRRDTRRNKLA